MTCSANVLSDNMFTLRNFVELSIDLPEYPPLEPVKSASEDSMPRKGC